MSAPRGKIPSALASKQGALTGKQTADARALALLPTIRELIAAGFASDGGLTNELNRKAPSFPGWDSFAALIAA
jgi:hypothetical protein